MAPYEFRFLSGNLSELSHMLPAVGSCWLPYGLSSRWGHRREQRQQLSCGACEKPCYFLVQGRRKGTEAVDSQRIKKSVRDGNMGLPLIIPTRGHHLFGLPCHQHCGDCFAYFISLILPQLH